MATVEFVGEGGEKLWVGMVTHDVPDDAAVTRAKEMMAQLTAFDSGPPRSGDIEDETENEEAAENTALMSELRSQSLGAPVAVITGPDLE